MVYSKHSPTRGKKQPLPPGLAEVKAILDSVDDSRLIARLWRLRRNGRPGYPIRSLWRASLARHLLNLPSINALYRRMEDDPALRLVCGFSRLPHRTTFNRFILRLADHQDLIDDALAPLTDQLRDALPGFGEKVAVDSTNVPTYSSPDKSVVSDPEASWTAKAWDGGKDWHFGYKEHALADAVYGVPIARFTTTASRHDSPTLPELLDKAKALHPWFAPTHVMADKGYDSAANHKAVLARNAAPIIALRQFKRKNDVYDNEGRPTCLGNVSMEYVKSDPVKGALYRCRGEGCPLKERKGVKHCQDEVWELPSTDNPRLSGPVRRDSQEWKELYALRQSVERVFKSLKQSRALGAHCVRGLARVGLHAAMSMLAFQATALYHVQAGQAESMRWQVRRVA